MIKAISDAGLSQTIYYCCIFLGWVLSFGYGVLFSKKYGYDKTKSFFMLLVFAVVNFATIRTVCWVQSGFQTWDQNMIKAFVYFPLTAWLVAKLYKCDYKTFLEFSTPCHCLTIAMAHVGCTIYGCCHGYPSDFGIYNQILEKTMFPNQPLEAVVALLVAVFSIVYAKKHNYNTKGRAYPLMMILMGYSRFFLEYLRDNKKLIWGISDLAVNSLFCGVVGTIALIYLFQKEKKESVAETK